jgi:hypothetical protein
MSSHDTGVPVEPEARYAGSHRIDNGDESEDEQASLVEEDVVVIETYDAADDGDPDAPEHGDSAETVAPETAPVRMDEGQWSEIKAMFVDDPGESVKRASGMVERALEHLMSSVRKRQDSLASWQTHDATGTEELRNALRGYQSLFDQLDGMSDRFRAGRDRVGSA